ncbi:MAG: response regulator [Anaerolineae bacterium]|nr:response regulator [Anaerolineae bacterium]
MMTKSRILVVEQDAIAASRIKDSLEKFGYEVPDHISPSIDVIDVVRKKRPDLVLIGIDLDEATAGFTIARQIYAQFDVPIVYLTPHSNNEILRSALKTEPFGFIFKPVARETLLASIETALHKHWAEQTLKVANAELKAIYDSSLNAHIVIDQNWSIKFFNRVASERISLFSGRPIEQGCPVHALFPEEDWQKFKDKMSQVLLGETVKVMQWVMSNGKKRWMQFYCNPVINDDGQVTGFCINAMDFVDLHTTTEMLSDGEQRLLSEIQSVLFTTEELVNSADLGNLLDFVVTQARHLSNAEGVAVLLLSPDQENLTVVSASTLGSRVEIGLQLPVKGWIADNVLTTHRIQKRIHEKDNPTWLLDKLFSLFKGKSLLCAPLTVRGKPLGILLLWSKEKDFFNDWNTPMIHLFANQVALALHNADLHIQNLELTVRQERHRLARELHDSVTQSLYSIGMSALAALGYARQGLDDKAKNAVELVHALSQTALAEIRTNLQEMYLTDNNEKSFGQMLESYCDSLKKQFNFEVDLTIDSNVELAGTQVEHLYYIAKEALWNTVKHATVDHAKVVLTKVADTIILTIEDRGAGFNFESLDTINTIGLRNLQERAEILRGRVTIQSKLGQGTRIKVQVPSE